MSASPAAKAVCEQGQPAEQAGGIRCTSGYELVHPAGENFSLSVNGASNSSALEAQSSGAGRANTRSAVCVIPCPSASLAALSVASRPRA